MISQSNLSIVMAIKNIPYSDNIHYHHSNRSLYTAHSNVVARGFSRCPICKFQLQMHLIDSCELEDVNIHSFEIIRLIFREMGPLATTVAMECIIALVALVTNLLGFSLITDYARQDGG